MCIYLYNRTKSFPLHLNCALGLNKTKIFVFVSRPVSIPSSSGADFPELPRFETDISFGFGDSFSAVENAANSLSGNLKHSSKFNYQEDPPKFQKKPVHQQDDDDEADYDRNRHQEQGQEHYEPEQFGPQPIDYEPESPYNLPAAPPAFSSMDSADFELSPEGQGKMRTLV